MTDILEEFEIQIMQNLEVDIKAAEEEIKLAKSNFKAYLASTEKDREYWTEQENLARAGVRENSKLLTKLEKELAEMTPIYDAKHKEYLALETENMRLKDKHKAIDVMQDKKINDVQVKIDILEMQLRKLEDKLEIGREVNKWTKFFFEKNMSTLMAEEDANFTATLSKLRNDHELAVKEKKETIEELNEKLKLEEIELKSLKAELAEIRKEIEDIEARNEEIVFNIKELDEPVDFH